MKTLYRVLSDPSTDPVYLTAAVVHSLIQPLPSGTAFCIGVVLLVMRTGRLVQTKGSQGCADCPSWSICAGAGIGWNARWSWAGALSMRRVTVLAPGVWPTCLSTRYGWAVSTARSTPSTRRHRPSAGGPALGLGGHRLLPSGWSGRAGQDRGRLDLGRDDSWGARGPSAPHAFWPQLPRRGGARLR